jgi:hypothetical protein
MKKKFRSEDFERFKTLRSELLSLKTWTKEKHKKKEEFLKFLNRYRGWVIYRKDLFKFSDEKTFCCWDYEVVTIPSKKTGFFYNLRNQSVLILCVNHWKYGVRELYVIPTFFVTEIKNQ